nr:hypothetical protein [Tanacetum cinerariifolium]
LGGGAGDNTGEGGDSIGGSGRKGISGGGEDQGDNGDAGGEDIARSLTTYESVHAGICIGAGIEILAVVRYVGCGGGVAADSSVSNDFVKHPHHMVGPQQRSHCQHALDLGYNLVKVVPALAPQG